MDKLTSKMSEVTIADSPRKQGVVQKKSVNLTVISSNMQTSNGCVYLHIKTMNELRIRTGDPILISPSSSKDSTGNTQSIYFLTYSAIASCWPPSKTILAENSIQFTHLISNLFRYHYGLYRTRKLSSQLWRNCYNKQFVFFLRGFKNNRTAC